MRVDWIDALKGVAILMVVTVHVSQAIPMPEWAKLVGSFGAMGVQFFFLLSAYLLPLHDMEGRRAIYGKGHA